MDSTVDRIRQECAVKILRWRNRLTIARMANVHVNTIARFVGGGEITVSTLIAIERAIKQIEQSTQYHQLCVTCED